jgi:hypothetical protein
MQVLELIIEIVKVHESGAFAVKHREGEFKTDKERWTAAAKVIACKYLDTDVPDASNWRLHDYIQYNINEFWKIYTRAALIS